MPTPFIMLDIPGLLLGRPYYIAIAGVYGFYLVAISRRKIGAMRQVQVVYWQGV